MRSHIHTLPDVFVFGSNLAGLHYSGAAKYAMDNCFAVMGIGEGRQGYSYALPTCSGPGVALPLQEVRKAVERFLRYAEQHPTIEFFMTRVGCGIAGFTDDMIAPMFTNGAYWRPNVNLPPEWDIYRQP